MGIHGYRPKFDELQARLDAAEAEVGVYRSALIAISSGSLPFSNLGPMETAMRAVDYFQAIANVALGYKNLKPSQEAGSKGEV
jgi:hypothetical protein